MSIKSDSSSSKIDQSPWGFSPTTAASVSFDNRDFKSITTIVGKVKEDWYPRGCVTMDRDKSRMTFDENGLANVLCSLGSFSSHQFEESEREAILTQAGEYHNVFNGQKAFVELEKMFTDNQADLEKGGKSAAASASTASSKKQKIDATSRIFTLLRTAADAPTDGLAEAFEKISSIDPEVAAALKDYREHQEIVLAALVNGMLKGNAHQFVKIKVQTAREAVDRSCQNAPELYKAYDAYPKVAYFLARLGESLMGRTLRLHDTTEQFDVIWNAEVSTVKDLRRFVSQCQANIRAYMQNHNARFPLPSDEVLVNQYLRKMGLSDDPTVRDLAIELTDAIKKLEESDEGITLHDLIDRLLQRLPAGDSDRTPPKKYKHPKSDQSDQADPQSAVANFTASDGWDRNSSNGQNGGKGKGKGKGKGYPNGKWQNPSKAKPGERPRDGFSEPARNDQAGVRGQYSPCNSPGRSAEGERSRCAICRSTTHSTEEHRGPSRKGKGNQSGSSSSSSNSQSAGGSPKSKRGGSN